MKVLTLLPLALAASAFVIPDESTIESLNLQDQQHEPHPFWDNIKDPAKIWEELEDRFDQAAKFAQDKFKDAADRVQEAVIEYGNDYQTAFAGESWLESIDEDFDESSPPPPPPHRGPPPGPPRGPPHGPPRRPPHGPPGGPPHKRPHHPPHHCKSNKTVYELIAESKYTTKLAEAISDFPDLVKLLNGTKANYTVFAPTDKAFEKIPKEAPKPPKSFLKKLLTYHVSPEFYPAGRILVTKTIPTALEAEFINDNPQRLATQVGFRGITINYYARVVYANKFGTNGVIHAIDSILLPPPKVVEILEILPGTFSTLTLGLAKTGLLELFNNTDLHVGGTLFAPSNFAFALLGPRINAFLFSQYGEKYLKALLLYHAGKEVTLYSDAIYKVTESSQASGIPKDFYHIDIPTGLDDKKLSVDVLRYGRLITIKINGFVRASTLDGIAADGVIHGVPVVLIPPRTPGEPGHATEDMSLEEFKERLDPYVEKDDYDFSWEL